MTNSLNIPCPCRSSRQRPCSPPPTPSCCSRDAACMPRAPSCGASCCRHIRQAGQLLGCALQQPRSVSQREHTKVVLRPVVAACWLRFPRCYARVFFLGTAKDVEFVFWLRRQTYCRSLTTAAVSLDSLTFQVYLRECTGRCRVRSLPLLHQLSPTRRAELCFRCICARSLSSCNSRICNCYGFICDYKFKLCAAANSAALRTAPHSVLCAPQASCGDGFQKLP